MSQDSITAAVPVHLLVLCVDVVDSTGLLERHGAEQGLAAIDACIRMLGEVIDRNEGRLARRTGDGAIAVFDNPAKGVKAASEALGAVAEAGEGGCFATVPLRIRIGVHFGATLDEGDDVFGEGPLTAAAVTRVARPGQALCTEDTVLVLPQAMSWGTRILEGTEVAAMTGPQQLYEILWQTSDITRISGALEAPAQLSYRRLELSHGERRYVCDASAPRLTLGRTSSNDVVVRSDLTSRQHAWIEMEQGRFHIEDSSVNGTLVSNDGGSAVTLRRERGLLGVSGTICLGGNARKNPDGVLRFRCLR